MNILGSMLAGAALFLAAACTEGEPPASAEAAPALNAAPTIRPDRAVAVAEGVRVIPDPRINYVPNIGVVEGAEAILVVDTGMGPRNGAALFDYVSRLADGRRIYLTSTHFHPEHNFGASAFPAGALILNRAQAAELAEKGESYVTLFRSFGAVETEALEGVRLVQPGRTYEGRMVLDLGGRQVELMEAPAHTRGDQLVWVADVGVLFTGDLVEDRFFPIMPDADAKGAQWIVVADRILALDPRIVVPGHGAVGDVGLVRALKAHLSTVQREVAARVESGMGQDQIVSELTPRLAALYPDWDNAVFIPYEIAIFYAEATGQPVRLPDLTADLQS